MGELEKSFPGPEIDRGAGKVTTAPPLPRPNEHPREIIATHASDIGMEPACLKKKGVGAGQHRPHRLGSLPLGSERLYFIYRQEDRLA